MLEAATLYDSVTTIAEDYFGPAAERYVNRIITAHLHKAPRQMTKKDIPKLASWVKVTVAVLVDDPGEVEAFVDRLERLAGNGQHKRASTR